MVHFERNYQNVPGAAGAAAGAAAAASAICMSYVVIVGRFAPPYKYIVKYIQQKQQQQLQQQQHLCRFHLNLFLTKLSISLSKYSGI